jgi:thiamine-phosphate pyrophosphorylase
MPMNPESLLLYAVTDRSWVGCQSLYEQVEAALRGGVTSVQLREKNLNEADFIHEALEMKELCRHYNVPLLINDNLRVALESGADGVHIGQEDMPASEVRKLAGKNFLIGVTAKTVEQAQRAQKEGADYLGVGAVFPSPTKKNAVRITAGQLREICRSVDIPAVAIGGIQQSNMSEIAGCGMCGIAVVSAIFAAQDITEAARSLRKEAEAII